MDASGNIQTCGEIDVKYVVTQKEIAERKLANLKTIYGNHIHTDLVLGKITDAILQYSAANHFDLIVMGTKGAWGIKEKLSGSETQLIARKIGYTGTFLNVRPVRPADSAYPARTQFQQPCSRGPATDAQTHQGF